MKLIANSIALILVVIAAGSACKKESASTEDDRKETSAATRGPASGSEKHAAAGVIPGSHEDWCEEHQVPESQCTRCNPKLIAAFKATGDWCNEHGVPESHCRQCNPNLKLERPPKSEGAR